MNLKRLGKRAIAWLARKRLHGLVPACGALALVLPGQFLLAQQPQADASAAVQSSPMSAAVNLNITPKRLVLGRGQRSGTVYIFNRGAAPATFDITLVDRVMLPNGEIRPVSDGGADLQFRSAADRLHSARGMIVAAPRRVTLQPGRGQTVRIRVQPVAGGSASEYRSHLTVTTLPPADFGLTAEDAAARSSNQLSFRVNSVFGVSIPVIIRPGAASAEGAIRDVRLTYADVSADGPRPRQQTAMLVFDLARTGTSSLFGNVEIRSRGRGRIGLARGLGVYTEIDQRTVAIPLQRLPAAGEELDVTFADDDGTPGRVIARASFRVP